MKKYCISVSTLFLVLFLMNQGQSAIPPVTQLHHQSYGGSDQKIAAKVGTDKDTVFVGIGLEVRVFEVDHSAPDNPTELYGGLNFSVEGYINDIAVHPDQSIILVACKKGLLIRDYNIGTNYPTPSSLANDGVSSVIFNNSGTTVFVGCYGPWFRVLDLTDPASASVIYEIYLLSNYDINGMDFRGSGGQDTLFTVGQGFKGLRMYNVTTPSNPTLIATSNSGDSVTFKNKRFSDVVVIRDSVYVADNDSGLRVFPCSNINFEGKLIPIQNTWTNKITAVKNDSFLVILSGDGFRVRDTRTGGMVGPIRFGQYGGSPSEIEIGGANLIYTAFGTNGFQIYNISNPLSPAQLGSGISTGDYVYDIIGDDRNYAYVANGIAGIRIIDLGTYTYSEVGPPLSYQSGDSYQKLLFHENNLIMLRSGGFEIVDVTDPFIPQKRGAVTGLRYIRDADVIERTGLNDTLFLVIGHDDGIRVFNITNPQSITQIGSTIYLSGGCNDIQIVKKANHEYIFAASGSGNFSIWGLSGNSTPIFIDSTIEFNQWIRFTTDGSYVYYITGDSVKKLDVRDPSNITKPADFDFYGIPGSWGFSSINLAGNFLHLGANNGRIFIVDITNSISPVLKDTFTVKDRVERLKINGLNLLVAAWGDGFYHLYDPYGAARVRLSKVTGMRTETVTMPVRLLDDLSQLGAKSFEMSIPFDTNYVQFVSLERGPGLPNGDSLLTNITHSSLALHTDTLMIARASSSEITGADTLFKMLFRINDNAPVIPLLQKATLNFSHLLFSEGFPAAEGSPGYINIIPLFGDANQNGEVTAADASYILQYVVKRITVPPPLVLADVSNNGEIRAYDAGLILKRLVDPVFKYPVETFYDLKKASAPVNSDARIFITKENIQLETGKAENNESLSAVYGISMQNINEVLSAEIAIDLGKGQKFLGYKLSSISEGMTVYYKQEGTMLYVSMARSEPITEDGTLIQLLCQVTNAEQENSIKIQQFILNETGIENIEGKLAGTPKSYTLSQNYPNPFNPVTEIKYELPNESKVILTIYNILGQQVRLLVNTTQPAGYYSVHWNGIDNTGMNVASGVYFYRIQAGNFVKTKKMIYMK